MSEYDHSILTITIRGNRNESNYFSGRRGNKTEKVHRKFTQKDAFLYGAKGRINAVPIIDENGRLLGDYTRWDDLLVLEYLNLFDEYPYFVEFLRGGEGNNHIALVKPKDAFGEKLSLMERWKSKINQLGIRVKVIDRMCVPEYIDKVDLVLFTDEDEMRGNFTLIEKIYHKEVSWEKFCTYKRVWERVREEVVGNASSKGLEYIKEKRSAYTCHTIKR